MTHVVIDSPKVQKPVLDARGHKEEISGLEWHDLSPHCEFPLPFDDHVALVTAVGFLIVHITGDVQLDLQFAALKGDVEPIPVRGRNLRGDFRGGDALAGVSLHGHLSTS